MANQVTTAVILAAGLGSRLKERTNEKPKAFLEIDDKTLIHRSIDALLSHGITKIIIGTGYLNHFFDELKSTYQMIETCRNDDFAQTGSMFTLYNLRHLLKEDFLLLEADLLYENAALKQVINTSEPDVILASGKTNSNDEVYIEANDHWKLVNMSKKIANLNHISCELVGISKISMSTFNTMCLYAEEVYRENKMDMHYEDNFVGISKTHPLHVLKIDDLAWCEIDDENHYLRALNLIYPKISTRNNA